MVKQRRQNQAHLDFLKWCMNHFIKTGIVKSDTPEHLVFQDWLSNYKLPKGQSLSLYIAIWHNDMFSQNLLISCEHKEITFFASDNFWEIDDSGLKWAYDGTWYFYCSKSKHPDRAFVNESFESVAPLFKRLILNYTGSKKLAVGFHINDDRNDE